MATCNARGEENGEEEEEDALIFYKMDAVPRGIAVIINNRDFTKDTQIPEAQELQKRVGTDLDKEALHQTFQGLKFDVKTYDNLKDTEIVNAIRDIANIDHSDFDCLVVCILSHGCLGKVYGVNGVAVPLKDLTFHVKPNHCPSLAGKPKLFFVQACQGKERQIGYPSSERDSDPMPDYELVPNEGDFLLSYSTVPGYESYRNAEDGSTYIANLTRYLQRYAATEEILHILIRVNNAVSKDHHILEDNHAYKQIPAPLYSLRKKVFFGHGITESTFQGAHRPQNPSLQKAAEADVPTSASQKMQGKQSEIRSRGADDIPLGDGMFRRDSYVSTPLVAREPIPYDVSFFTGNVPEADTDATICITLFGVKGTTVPIQLRKGAVTFIRGGKETLQFQMKDVSPLKKLRVSIDTTKSKKMWKLDKIEVVSLASFTTTVFPFYGWLGPEKDGAKPCVDIAATERGKVLLQATTYTITVKTSKKPGAGTDANVFVVLFGVNGDSCELPLRSSQTHKNPFEKGNVDVFTFTDILSLGDLYKLRVWHDNKGVGAAWHLSSVEVKDESTKKSYNFPFDRWLSSKDDDHQTLREMGCAQIAGPTTEVVYEIEVSTSDEKNSGTNHDGWLVLEGDSSTSNLIPLENSSHHRILRRGQTNFFTLSSPCLGSLRACTIGANKKLDYSTASQKGEQDKWRCEEIAVTDTSTGIRSIFAIRKWVTVLPTVVVKEGLQCTCTRSEETHFAKAKRFSPILYEVEVYTGNKQGGGTDANVSITLFGEHGDTGKRPLTKGGGLKNLFEAGKADKFKLEALDLGKLTELYIEHDNTGVAPAWYLDHIMVTNTKDASTVCFPCKRWLRDCETAQQLKGQ